jgi:hypothetical protein
MNSIVLLLSGEWDSSVSVTLVIFLAVFKELHFDVNGVRGYLPSALRTVLNY